MAPQSRRTPPRRVGGPARTPTGRKAVYVRRRVVALLAVGVLAAGLVWGLGKVFGILRSAWADAVAEQTAPRAEPVQPGPCPPADLRWTMAPQSSRAGSPVEFVLTVRNGSPESCLVDAGASLVLTVTSGDDSIWSTAHCGTGESVPLLLGPDDEATRTVTWQGSRTAPGCTEVSSRVHSGTYRVDMTYDSVEVPEGSAVFALR